LLFFLKSHQFLPRILKDEKTVDQEPLKQKNLIE
jgi:hypothetical protein